MWISDDMIFDRSWGMHDLHMAICECLKTNNEENYDLQIVDLHELGSCNYPNIPEGMQGLRLPNLNGEYEVNGKDVSVMITVLPTSEIPLVLFDTTDDGFLLNQYTISDEQWDVLSRRVEELKKVNKAHIEFYYMMPPHHRFSLEGSYWVLWENDFNLYMGTDPFSDPYLPRIHRAFLQY